MKRSDAERQHSHVDEEFVKRIVFSTNRRQASFERFTKPFNTLNDSVYRLSEHNRFMIIAVRWHAS